MLLKSMLEITDPSPPNFLRNSSELKRGGYLEKGYEVGVEAAPCGLPMGAESDEAMKAVEAGVVAAVVDLLLNTTEKRACEMVMTVVDMLCQCADEWLEVVGHVAGLAVVLKKILRVSKATS